VKELVEAIGSTLKIHTRFMNLFENSDDARKFVQPLVARLILSDTKSLQSSMETYIFGTDEERYASVLATLRVNGGEELANDYKTIRKRRRTQSE